MNSITLNQYLKYILDNKLIHKLQWLISVIAIHDNGVINEYIKIEDNKGYVYIDGEYVLFEGYVRGNAFIRIGDMVLVKADYLKSLDKDTETHFGRFLLNYLLIEKVFQGKLKYIHDSISLSAVINLVKDALSNDVISVDEYKSFVSVCTYLESFNKLVTPSSTPKLLIPPTGLKAFKTGLNKEFTAKFGADWDKDPARVVDYDNQLKAFYSEYIKDDPSDGIIANGKNKDNALAKKYLTFSSTNAFGEQVHIEESLLDGYPSDPEKLAAMFNTTRSASHSRGAETQTGGGVAKSVLRATSSITILDTDCGVTYGKRGMITKDNVDGMIGRNIIEKGKLILLTTENVSSYVDKTVELRSAMYCKAARPHICKACAGDKAAGHPNGVALIVTNISSALTTASLKAMHNTQISTVKASLDEMIY